MSDNASMAPVSNGDSNANQSANIQAMRCQQLESQKYDNNIALKGGRKSKRKKKIKTKEKKSKRKKRKSKRKKRKSKRKKKKIKTKRKENQNIKKNQNIKMKNDFLF